jgi:hypothetical protein
VPLVRGCRVPWCPNYHPCPAHPPPPRHANYAPLPPGWKQTRAAQLAAFPHCAHCGAVATEAHHPDRARRPDWLQSLCHRCHATVTGRAGGHASA